MLFFRNNFGLEMVLPYYARESYFLRNLKALFYARRYINALERRAFFENYYTHEYIYCIHIFNIYCIYIYILYLL